ncbi:MAG: hypothetical protein LAT54_02745 [Cryomorphaceae bacterium]|nr:hypothetical protein [Cryomorphaceae bacterium]
MKPIKTFLVLVFMASTLVACRDYREVNFWVINETAEDLTVRYRVRVCLGLNSNCFPQNLSQNVSAGDSIMLQIQDQITTDYDIEESFFGFELEQNEKISTVDIWKGKLVEKIIFEEHIEFYLRVDDTFF